MIVWHFHFSTFIVSKKKMHSFKIHCLHNMLYSPLAKHREPYVHVGACLRDNKQPCDNARSCLVSGFPISGYLLFFTARLSYLLFAIAFKDAASERLRGKRCYTARFRRGACATTWSFVTRTVRGLLQFGTRATSPSSMELMSPTVDVTAALTVVIEIPSMVRKF